uniref:Glutamyl-tRNA(Gln) amidotransferase subunit B, mitochondrial n=1 Tax=Chromera velia CCMP2878 TaxID=1169474 RepID=A0A0G4HLB9_9ALVE|mmetsp:Transcript_3644/g.7529  ORF Transcript_3644/g.7529 Transcript_3644/m.7529 type:complete len:614 (+) Transcript_3644:144-1985(+)|eukprot:Cvel_28674.t1-p1 / transcript=Cvel_28674.t1 / gene=Cvel_28674 / organism=Chromera_velia_CCMP2878 / gene_product=Aspartyl/glutamyl-tRNA(Asn/Gln) amidotransferase, putative / transcript_product=Aspartyl/glutamyl-tRNA(Asn/Gln) amidotransferase, putative / location=Cvel_scaffold3800:9399-12750(-) / protein_length=613 / sequence_SO=supercontig / SO=protein_coding / is_pseudo=false
MELEAASRPIAPMCLRSRKLQRMFFVVFCTAVVLAGFTSAYLPLGGRPLLSTRRRLTQPSPSALYTRLAAVAPPVERQRGKKNKDKGGKKEGGGGKKKERKRDPLIEKYSKNWETVVGVECHIQLDTATKAYCNCATKFEADSPNVNVCPVCMGEPGSLPVPNLKVVEMAAKAGMALHCNIAKETKFDRKNYFYPDTPKNYQITQYDIPIASEGYIELPPPLSKRVGIERLHMEEDSGKMYHIGGDGSAVSSDYSLVDFNRAGIPLVEVVSKADMRSGEEAAEYGRELARVMQYLGASDCVMAEGSMRCDVNVSVRPRGRSELRTKVEVKNLNSFRAVQQAIDFETIRQARIYEGEGEEGEVVRQETRLWDEKAVMTKLLRVKEGEADYRYFPEPDIPPLHIEGSTLEEWKDALPELPYEKRRKYAEEWGVRDDDSRLLLDDKAVAAFFEEAVEAGKQEYGLDLRSAAEGVSRWLLNDIAGFLGDKKASGGLTFQDLKMTPRRMAELVALQEQKVINSKAARELLRDLLTSWEGSVEDLVDQRDMRSLNDEKEIERVAKGILAAYPDRVTAYKNGTDRIKGFFVGQVLKETNNRADPEITMSTVLRLLDEAEG